MAKQVPLGAQAECEEAVTPEKTLAHWQDFLPAVYSTPNMIRLMEESCYYALQPYCEGDEVSVGTHINVKRTAATPLGARVRAEGVVEAFDGRFYTFRVRA